MRNFFDEFHFLTPWNWSPSKVGFSVYGTRRTLGTSSEFLYVAKTSLDRFKNSCFQWRISVYDTEQEFLLHNWKGFQLTPVYSSFHIDSGLSKVMKNGQFCSCLNMGRVSNSKGQKRRKGWRPLFYRLTYTISTAGFACVSIHGSFASWCEQAVRMSSVSLPPFTKLTPWYTSIVGHCYLFYGPLCTSALRRHSLCCCHGCAVSWCGGGCMCLVVHWPSADVYNVVWFRVVRARC